MAPNLSNLAFVRYLTRNKRNIEANVPHIKSKLNEMATIQGMNLSTEETAVDLASSWFIDEVSAHPPYFCQTPPKLTNSYATDATLKRWLKSHMPGEVLREIEADLHQFGERAVTDIARLSDQCEQEPPRLEQYSAWGRRVDKLWTSAAWKKMHDIAAEEGLISIAYERKYGPWSRVYQVVKNYLFAASSGMYSCPLAMTDGAARIIERGKPEMQTMLTEHAFRRLTSRNAAEFWTSGQWMTEREGGSDVAGGTDTCAFFDVDPTLPNGPRNYRLYGYKWFSSATDADMAFTLARIADDKGHVTPGSAGLSLFYVQTGFIGSRVPQVRDTTSNGIRIVKLKNKLGTRQLPTAELVLNGTMANLMSEPGRGVAAISTMLVLTRIHNAISAVSYMRRIVDLARNYSTVRVAFGKPIFEHALHARTLSLMEMQVQGSLVFLLEVSRLLGLEECGMASDDQKALLRILTPLLKLFTAKEAVAVVSEGLECFGGQGYIEDTGLPRILRDAQVLPIWEGTTNVLALDMVRAMKKSKDHVLNILYADIRQKVALGGRGAPRVEDLKPFVLEALEKLVAFTSTATPDMLEMAARDLAMSLARTYITALLIEQARKEAPLTLFVATEWASRPMCLLDPAGYGDSLKVRDVLLHEHPTVFEAPLGDGLPIRLAAFSNVALENAASLLPMEDAMVLAERARTKYEQAVKKAKEDGD